MCGIFCSVSKVGVYCTPNEELRQRLIQRGPDQYGVVEEEIIVDAKNVNADVKQQFNLAFCSSVLSLRGDHVTRQPLCSDLASKSILCWNGEAWKIKNQALIDKTRNDGQTVFALLLAAAQGHHASRAEADASHDGPDIRGSLVLERLSTIAGPFAFVFWDALNARLYFGRDCLGRRSLLVKATEELLLISSVGDGSLGWHEVEADGIYCVDLLSSPDVTIPTIDKTYRAVPFSTTCTSYPAEALLTTLNRDLSQNNTPRLDLQSPAVSTLEALLRASLQTRIESIPHIGQPTEPVSLPTRLAILFSGGVDCSVLARLAHDLVPPAEYIDLLNVAFHNPRVHGASPTPATYDTCPDRITARSTYAELLRVCPSRQWRLVEINIPYTETLEHRSLIKSLIAPHETEMDLSIASALYFASRATGQIHTPSNPSSPTTTTSPTPFYKTPARVLLSGLGADELFAGYQRHALAHQRGGLGALVDELELDLKRLGRRNLGRDDRVIAHWGREARYPFLDEDVVGWAARAPIWEKCGFGAEEEREGMGPCGKGADIEPGKKVLRLLACKLGMVGVAREKKRAIQFGARTAKMETGRTKGTTRI